MTFIADGLIDYPLVRHFLGFSGTSETLNLVATSGDTSIDVNNPATFTVGDEIFISEVGVPEEEHDFLIVIAKPGGNTLTLNQPIDHDYTVAAVVEIVAENMNVAGTLAAPVSYVVKPPAGRTFRIFRVIFTMTDATTMDDSKFGGIGALTNGALLRKVLSTHTHSIGGFRSNGAFRQKMFDSQYLDRAPAGEFGFGARFSFFKFGNACLLDGTAGDEMEILIQDNLGGLLSFEAVAEGQVLEL